MTAPTMGVRPLRRALVVASAIFCATLVAPTANAWPNQADVTANGTVSCNGIAAGRGSVGFFYVGSNDGQGGWTATQPTKNWLGQQNYSRKSFARGFTVPGNGITLTVQWSCTGDSTAFKEVVGLKRPTTGNTATWNFAPNSRNQDFGCPTKIVNGKPVCR